jgi:uncharacterized protein YecA (UPF0149 family)
METKKIAVVGNNANAMLAAGDIPENFGLLYTEEALQHLEMIKEYECIERSLYSKKHNESKIIPVRNSSINPKINRNELCACGSGKKYKKCCLITCS